MTAISRNCADSLSTDTDHTNKVGQNNNSASAARAGRGPNPSRNGVNNSSAPATWQATLTSARPLGDDDPAATSSIASNDTYDDAP